MARNLLASLLTLALTVSCGGRSNLEVREEDPPVKDAPDPPAPPPPPAPPDPEPPEPPDPPVPPECAGPEVTYIYVVTGDNRLLAFKPQSDTVEVKGTLDCPTEGTPFSMAVSRDAVAQILYTDGRIYEVDIEDASCTPTSYVPAPPDDPFFQFGMGYAANEEDDGETLYVAGITFDAPSAGLARIDTETYERTVVGAFSQNPGNAVELTPTGIDGPLYGYFLNTTPPGGTLVQIDTETGDILEATLLDIGNGSGSLAVAWWGGAFYVFFGQGGSTTVTRYDPDTQQIQDVGTIAGGVVGAGVSTCAPGRLP